MRGMAFVSETELLALSSDYSGVEFERQGLVENHGCVVEVFEIEVTDQDWIATLEAIEDGLPGVDLWQAILEHGRILLTHPRSDSQGKRRVT